MEGSGPESEEGLTLFQHMRAREHRNYLNNCKDDIEEIKYRDGLSTFRISGSTPTRGGGLLVSDAEKNDYDWLLTPPGTPLFPSLDQETANLKLSQRPPSTGLASASKASKEAPLKSLSKLCQSGGVAVAQSTVHASPSPQRAKTASPSRTATSSSKARSLSPSPSSTGSHPRLRAFSPGMSVTTTTLSPVRARKSMSPLLSGGHGFSARRGPRRSLSPRLSPWEPVMAACSTEPPPNLRTSPSNRSIQRGNVEGSGKGASFRIGGSSQEIVLNCERPKWKTMSADNIEIYSFSSKLKQVNGESPDTKNEIVARRNLNKGPCIVSMSQIEDNKNCSYARRQTPVSTMNKEVISDFANEKLMKRQMPTGMSLPNMFRPLMSSAPAILHHKIKPESSNYEMSRPISPSVSGNGRSKRHMKVLLESHRIADQGELSQRYCSVDTGPRTVNGLREMNFPCKTYNNGGTSETSLTKLVGETEDAKALNPLIQNSNSKCCRNALPTHIYIAETQMLNGSSNREKVSDHGREAHRMLSNKAQLFAGNNFNKDSMDSNCESLSLKLFRNKPNGSQHGARLPVRRQLSMANADMIYGTWKTKNTESFDISTSDSYSWSESLDSSFVDNHTEKFSEEFSEVDSMSHRGFSKSNSSPPTIHLLNNLISPEKPLSKMSTDIDTEQDKLPLPLPRNCRRATLEDRDFFKENNENKQRMLASTESMDSSHFLKRVCGDHGLSSESVRRFMQALDLKQIHSSTQLVYKDQCKSPATGLNLNAVDGGIGEIHAVKPIVVSAAMDEARDCDENCKQEHPQTSPLKRNVTLEEATDTILFCSSIVHKIVHEATALGEERSNMNSEDPAKGCVPVCNSESGRSSMCWSWNRRSQPLHNNVVHKIVDMEPHRSETMLSMASDGKGLPSPHHTAGELQQKRKKKCGFCCFSS